SARATSVSIEPSEGLPVTGTTPRLQCSGRVAMPLRDHFRPPLDNVRSWEELHGGWPMMLVAALSKKLPPRYVAGPRVDPGAYFEIDVASYEEDVPTGFAPE